MSGEEAAKNVLGGQLMECCSDPVAGFFRDGYCRTDENDQGSHTVCAIVSDAFLEFSKSKGNDLTTPVPEFDFPGLKAGDGWCVCAARWHEAYEAGAACKVRLASTHEKALDIVPLEALLKHAIDRN